jgi:hypothetical protein
LNRRELLIAVITYEVDGSRQLDIEVHFQPILNLMWPAALGGPIQALER